MGMLGYGLSHDCSISAKISPTFRLSITWGISIIGPQPAVAILINSRLIGENLAR